RLLIPSAGDGVDQLLDGREAAAGVDESLAREGLQQRRGLALRPELRAGLRGERRDLRRGEHRYVRQRADEILREPRIRAGRAKPRSRWAMTPLLAGRSMETTTPAWGRLETPAATARDRGRARRSDAARALHHAQFPR